MERFWCRNDTRLSAVGRKWYRVFGGSGRRGRGAEEYVPVCAWRYSSTRVLYGQGLNCDCDSCDVCAWDDVRGLRRREGLLGDSEGASGWGCDLRNFGLERPSGPVAPQEQMQIRLVPLAQQRTHPPTKPTVSHRTIIVAADLGPQTEHRQPVVASTHCSIEQFLKSLTLPTTLWDDRHEIMLGVLSLLRGELIPHIRMITMFVFRINYKRHSTVSAVEVK